MTAPPIPVTLAELTPRQIAVAAMVARGESDKRIASQLGMSLRSVQNYLVSIAYLADVDPDRNTRIQIATWYRAQVPISVYGAA